MLPVVEQLRVTTRCSKHESSIFKRITAQSSSPTWNVGSSFWKVFSQSPMNESNVEVSASKRRVSRKPWQKSNRRVSSDKASAFGKLRFHVLFYFVGFSYLDVWRCLSEESWVLSWRSEAQKIFVDEQLSYSKYLDCSECCCYLTDWLHATQRKKFAFLE